MTDTKQPQPEQDPAAAEEKRQQDAEKRQKDREDELKKAQDEAREGTRDFLGRRTGTFDERQT